MKTSIKPNILTNNDESTTINLERCSICGWVKPINSLYVIPVKSQRYSEISGLILSSTCEELWCRNCVVNYK